MADEITFTPDMERVITALPFTPSTTHGRGFLAPFARTTGHFLYLLGRTSDTAGRRPTDNQIQQELDALTEHLADFVVPEYLSTQAKTYVDSFREGIEVVKNGFLGWDETQRRNNLLMFTNRILQLHVFLDREVLGIRDSDAGQSL